MLFFFFLHIHFSAVVTLDVVFVSVRVGAECGAVPERHQGCEGGEGVQGEGADSGACHFQTERFGLQRLRAEEQSRHSQSAAL